MSLKSKLISLPCALAVAVACAGAAQAEEPTIDMLDRPGAKLEDSIRTHKIAVRYEAIAARAVRLAERAPKVARRPVFELAPGVSQSALDAIAACESGGNPTVVDASGTYHGLYQFDMGTWASVGGKGSPAEASPEEQSYRASLLYSRAGSSPWPVCG